MTSKNKKTVKDVVDMAAYKRLEKENAKLKLKLPPGGLAPIPPPL